LFVLFKQAYLIIAQITNLIHAELIKKLIKLAR